MSTMPTEFPPHAFDRVDQDDDSVFYAPARLVTHIDDLAIAALVEFYSEVLRPGTIVLDLMSSWVSHLPADLDLSQIIGHGMNPVELAANSRVIPTRAGADSRQGFPKD